MNDQLERLKIQKYYESHNIADISNSKSFHASRPLSDDDLSKAAENSGRIHSSFYREIYPIELIFETARPQNPEEFLTVSYFSPDIYHTSSMSYRQFMATIASRDMHQADYFELMYVIEGEVYQRVEGVYHIYPKGSVCFLNKGILHAEEFTTDFRVVFVAIPDRLAQELLDQIDNAFFEREKIFLETDLYQFLKNADDRSRGKHYLDFIPIDANGRATKSIHDAFNFITDAFMNPIPSSTITIKAHLLRMFCILSNPEYYRTIPVSIGTTKENEIFNEITDLLARGHGHLSRSALEAATNYSGAYINTIVKKYTGVSLFKYSMQICMREAEGLLIDSDLSVSEIAVHLGFSNRTHFYKLFEEEHGVTPREYRLAKKSL